MPRLRLWGRGQAQQPGPGPARLKLPLPQVPGGEDPMALPLEEGLRLPEATCPFGGNAEVSRTRRACERGWRRPGT